MCANSHHFLMEQYLVGGFNQPLWKIWKSVGIVIPNICKNKKCFQTTNQDGTVWKNYQIESQKTVRKNTLNTKFHLGNSNSTAFSASIFTNLHHASPTGSPSLLALWSCDWPCDNWCRVLAGSEASKNWENHRYPTKCGQKNQGHELITKSGTFPSNGNIISDSVNSTCWVDSATTAKRTFLNKQKLHLNELNDEHLGVNQDGHQIRANMGNPPVYPTCCLDKTW